MMREVRKTQNDQGQTVLQVWQAVHGESPMTPQFFTEDDLISYLVESGDFAIQKKRDEDKSFRDRFHRGYSTNQAKALVTGKQYPDDTNYCEGGVNGKQYVPLFCRLKTVEG